MALTISGCIVQPTTVSRWPTRRCVEAGADTTVRRLPTRLSLLVPIRSMEAARKEGGHGIYYREDSGDDAIVGISPVKLGRG